MSATFEGGPRPVVLLVDDEPDILESFQSLMEYRLGATVLTAPSGPRALEILRTTSVDLVVSDFKMPGMDGLAFLTLARQLRPDAPLVLMTAFPDLQVELASSALGLAGFFSKAIDPDAFMDELGLLL